MWAKNRIEAVNDFVLRFANVNGTGSASANLLMAHAFYRLGLPIGPKNMFPSNIQGLPTWFEIRVNEHGFTGRRGGADFLVAMNPQTFWSDLGDVQKGGYVLYDATRYVDPEKLPDQLNYFPVPLTELIRGAFPLGRAQLLLKNIVYIGVLTYLLDVDPALIVHLLEEQYQTKPKLIPANKQAFQIGYQYAQEHFQHACLLRVQSLETGGTTKKILMSGNEAVALGCLFAGATVCAWYPITPSTSVIDYFDKYCRQWRQNESQQNRYAIIQAEDEIAALGMVLGASWNGARAFTATSGPGISLMNELIGYAYYAEIPAVIINVQRCGPSTGMPTRTQQADLLLCAYASHGDTKHIMLFPSTPHDCFEWTLKAFDLAEVLQTPIFVMSDLELGMNEYWCEPLDFKKDYSWNRGKLLRQGDQRLTQFYRYQDVDGDAIPYRTLPGDDAAGAYFTRGSGHDQFGRYTEDGQLYQENLDRIARKINETSLNYLPEPICHRAMGRASDDWGLICLGTTLEPLREAQWLLSQEGYHLDILQIRAFPFHPLVFDYIVQFKQGAVVVEQNQQGQLCKLLLIEGKVAPEKLRSLTYYDGLPITAQALVSSIKQCITEHKA